MSRGSSGSRPASTTIRTRIFLVMSTFLILSMFMTGYALYLCMQAGRQETKQDPRTPEITLLAGTISKTAAALRKQTRLFVQNRDPQVTAQHQATLDRLDQMLDRLQAAGTPGSSRTADRVRPLVKAHATAFDELVNSLAPLAQPDNNQSAGKALQEKLSSTIQDLATAVPRSDAAELKDTLTQLRQLETAYLETDDIAVGEQLDTTVRTLEEIINRLPAADNGVKQELQDSIKTYAIALERYQAVSFHSDDETLKAAFAAVQERQKMALRTSGTQLEKSASSLKPSLLELKAAEMREIVRHRNQGDGDLNPDRLTVLLDEYAEALDLSALAPEQKGTIAQVVREAGATLAELSSRDNPATDTAVAEKALKEATARALRPLARIAAEMQQLKPPPPKSQFSTEELMHFLRQPDILPVAGATGILFVLGLIAAMGLARSATSPAAEMTDTARQLAGGDVNDLLFPADRKDEFGVLASALNDLLAGCREPASSPEPEETEQEDKDREQGEHPAPAVSDEAAILLDKIGSAAHQIINLSRELPRTIEQLAAHNRSIHELLAEPLQPPGAPAHMDASEALTRLRDTNREITEMGEGIKVLALNAAIKASRAGTHGREFAAVGEELEELAGRASELAANLSLVIDKCPAADEPGGSGGEVSGPDHLARIAELNAAGSEAVDKIAVDTNIIIDQARDVEQLVSELSHLVGDETEVGRQDTGAEMDDLHRDDGAEGLEREGTGSTKGETRRVIEPDYTGT